MGVGGWVGGPRPWEPAGLFYYRAVQKLDTPISILMHIVGPSSWITLRTPLSTVLGVIGLFHPSAHLLTLKHGVDPLQRM